MATKKSSTVAAVAGAATITVSQTEAAASADAVSALVAKLRRQDDNIRGPAWQGAGPLGAPAVKALAAVMADQEPETARCAKRALYKIVRHAGRPSAGAEAKAVERELIGLLAADSPAPVRCEVLWMLSEIGGAEAVSPMAALLGNEQLREDARCALMRLPGGKVTAAFKTAFATAPETFKYALAESLRQRGARVKGYPSRKLSPERQTAVQPKKAS
jgi:HEAT repeat protein